MQPTLLAWERLLRFHAKVTDVLQHELEAEVGMPLTWYDVLVQLRMAPDRRLRMQDLADHVVLSRSGLTRLVDRLEAEGLVARVTCPSDRRGMFAELTPEGERRFEAAAPAHRRGILRHFSSHLSADDAATLARVFGELVDALDE